MGCVTPDMPSVDSKYRGRVKTWDGMGGDGLKYRAYVQDDGIGDSSVLRWKTYTTFFRIDYPGIGRGALAGKAVGNFIPVETVIDKANW